MQIPEFKPSKVFAGDVQVPCLAARLRNSRIPGLSTAYRAENEEDPLFKVYLRSATPGEITPWQRQFLERLFTREELVPAIAAGMKEYEESMGYDENEVIERDGILPHLYLTRIIIDDLGQEVILGVHTVEDGNLDEHGIAIHWQEGRWKFDPADYFSDYINNLDFEEPGPPEDKEHPPDIRDLYGRWVLDMEATAERLKKLGMASLVKSTLESWRGMYYEISEQGVKFPFFGVVKEARILGCEWNGRKVLVNFQYGDDKADGSFGGKYRKDQIISDSDVFRREPLDAPLPPPVWTRMDPSPLYGRWVGRTRGLPINMSQALEFAEQRITITTKFFWKRDIEVHRWVTCTARGKEIHFETRLQKAGTERPADVEVVLKGGKLIWAGCELTKKTTPPRRWPWRILRTPF